MLCLLPLRLSILGAPAPQCPMPYTPRPPTPILSPRLSLGPQPPLCASASTFLGLHSRQGAISSCLSPVFKGGGHLFELQSPILSGPVFGASAISGIPCIVSCLAASLCSLCTGHLAAPSSLSGPPTFSGPFLSHFHLKLVRSHFLPCLGFHFLAALPAPSLVACPFAVGKQELVAGSF